MKDNAHLFYDSIYYSICAFEYFFNVSYFLSTGEVLIFNFCFHSTDKEPSDSPMYTAFAMLTTPKSTPTLQRRTPIEELPVEGTSTEASSIGDTKASKAKTLSVGSQPSHQEKKKVKTSQHRSLSDQCFIALFWAFVLVRLWMHAWILLLIPIPVLFMIFKKLCKYNSWL